MKFEVNYPDWELSPYTGMTKKHWIDACYFLLEGIFSNVTDIDKPIRCPRTEFVISYPNKHTAPWKEYAAKFEGLARSFLLLPHSYIMSHRQKFVDILWQNIIRDIFFLL